MPAILKLKEIQAAANSSNSDASAAARLSISRSNSASAGQLQLARAAAAGGGGSSSQEGSCHTGASALAMELAAASQCGTDASSSTRGAGQLARQLSFASPTSTPHHYHYHYHPQLYHAFSAPLPALPPMGMIASQPDNFAGAAVAAAAGLSTSHAACASQQEAAAVFHPSSISNRPRAISFPIEEESAGGSQPPPGSAGSLSRVLKVKFEDEAGSSSQQLPDSFSGWPNPSMIHHAVSAPLLGLGPLAGDLRRLRFGGQSGDEDELLMALLPDDSDDDTGLAWFGTNRTPSIGAASETCGSGGDARDGGGAAGESVCGGVSGGGGARAAGGADALTAQLDAQLDCMLRRIEAAGNSHSAVSAASVFGEPGTGAQGGVEGALGFARPHSESFTSDADGTPSLQQPPQQWQQQQQYQWQQQQGSPRLAAVGGNGLLQQQQLQAHEQTRYQGVPKASLAGGTTEEASLFFQWASEGPDDDMCYH